MYTRIYADIHTYANVYAYPRNSCLEAMDLAKVSAKAASDAICTCFVTSRGTEQVFLNSSLESSAAEPKAWLSIRCHGECCAGKVQKITCIYACTHIYIYIHVRILLLVVTYARTHIHTYIHTYIHTCKQTNIRTYIHTYVRAIHT